MPGQRYLRAHDGRRGGAKLIWVLVLGFIIIALAVVAVVVAGAGYWFWGGSQPPAPVPAAVSPPAPVAPPGVAPTPPSGKPSTVTPAVPQPVAPQSSGSAADIEQARAAMMQYGSDREKFPYRVDDVQVRGSRAIGNYTPVKRDGSIDEERPGGLFVAHKVNGRWVVFALGTDIIDPWAEPISRIYGDA